MDMFVVDKQLKTEATPDDMLNIAEVGLPELDDSVVSFLLDDCSSDLTEPATEWLDFPMQDFDESEHWPDYEFVNAEPETVRKTFKRVRPRENNIMDTSTAEGSTADAQEAKFESYKSLAFSSKFVVVDAKGVPRYTCPFPGCSHRGSRQSSLLEHMELHRPGKGKYFPCKVCRSVFYSPGSLKSHQATHKKEKHKYVCKHAGCCKKYSTIEGLRLHNRNYHEINKPWKCFHRGCGTCFVRKSDLKLHIVRMHITERPFPCTIQGCTRRFACHSELRRHLSKFHHLRLPKPSKYSFENPKLPLLDNLLERAKEHCEKNTTTRRDSSS